MQLNQDPSKVTSQEINNLDKVKELTTRYDALIKKCLLSLEKTSGPITLENLEEKVGDSLDSDELAIISSAVEARDSGYQVNTSLAWMLEHPEAINDYYISDLEANLKDAQKMYFEKFD